MAALRALQSVTNTQSAAFGRQFVWFTTDTQATVETPGYLKTNDVIDVRLGLDIVLFIGSNWLGYYEVTSETNGAFTLTKRADIADLADISLANLTGLGTNWKLILGQPLTGPVMLDWYCVGDGVADDTAGINTAIALGRPMLGTPGKTYRYVGRLTATGNNFNLDLQGATLKIEYTAASGETDRYVIRSGDNTLGAINTVSVQTAGSNQVVLSTTPSGIVVGGYVGFFGTSLGGRWPVTWRQVTGISTNTLTLDEMIPYAIGGTVTCRAGNFRGEFVLCNGIIDVSGVMDGTANVETIVAVESYTRVLYSRLTIKGVNLQLVTTNYIFNSSYCLDVETHDCDAPNAVMNGGFDTCFYARSHYTHDNHFSVPGFGFASLFCDGFWIEDNILSGNKSTAPTVSVRGIRPIGCLAGSIEGNTITDIDSGIKLEDCANITVKANTLRYCRTAISPCNDQFPSPRSGGHIIDGNTIEQFTAEGISVGGNSTGDGVWKPVTIINNIVGSTVPGSFSPYIVRGGTIIAYNNTATDWASGQSPFVTVDGDAQTTKGTFGSFVAVANTLTGRNGVFITSGHTSLLIDYDRVLCNSPNGKFANLPPRKFASNVCICRQTVNMNTTADQPLTLELPDGFTRYRHQAMLVVSNAAASSAVGGVYTGAGKTGTQIIDATQTYTLLTGAGSNQIMTLTTAGAQVINDLSLFFSLTTPHGSAATGELIIMAIPIT